MVDSRHVVLVGDLDVVSLLHLILLLDLELDFGLGWCALGLVGRSLRHPNRPGKNGKEVLFDLSQSF